MANIKLNGITEATTKPERQLPSSKTTTKITISDPSIRFSATVNVVFAISSLRSKKPLIYTPSGNVFCMDATRFLTVSITSLELPSLSIMICPNTFSPSPFPVMAPKRVALPKPTVATSFMYIGEPSFLTTLFSISSSEPTRPSPRIKKALSFFSI